MSEETEQTVYVTGPRKVSDPSPAGASLGAAATITFSSQSRPDVFEQSGGGETITTASFALINGDLVVRLPGYDFPIKIPAASWERMSDAEKGAFIKLMTEFSQSAELVGFLDHLQTQGVSVVEIHHDDDYYSVDGTQHSFPTGRPEVVVWMRAEPGGDETDLRYGTKVVITIDSRVVRDDPKQFAELVIHALGHPLHGTDENIDETHLRGRQGHIYDQIFSTPGERETRPEDYYEGTTITGSRHDDNVTAGTGNDTLSGLSGNDILNGGLGNDYVMGGAGMDRLSGGGGDNVVAGGLDADTYAPDYGGGREYIVDVGGVDRIDLSAFSINDCLFFRTVDSLAVYLPSGLYVLIEDQWLAGSKVEQFIFADGTYASSFIEYLAQNGNSTGTGFCYDENGRQIMCNPYGLPVVFDLDGDGIELVPIGRSHARFDLDGDGTRDRLGWVGRDDGILALDRNGNGRIDDFSEMSFVQDFLGAGTDLEGLFAYDSNGDGFLTPADDRFGEFLVWRDSNGNGKSEKHELFTLADLEIVSIGLERSDINALKPDDEANQILATSVFQTADGNTHRLGDVALFVQLAASDCGCHAQQQLYDTAPIELLYTNDGLIP